MLNVRGDKYKLLYDYKVSKINAVKIEKLKEGEKPSILSDTMFKTMFLNEKRIKYSAKFISYYLDISYEKLLQNISLSKSRLDKEKKKSKEYESDYVAIIDDTRINIEVNNNSDEVTLKRNIDYAFKLYGSSIRRSKNKKSYKYNQVIQFNINNFSYIGNEKIVDMYTIKNEEGIRLTNNIIIIQIYIPNLRKKWYNKEKLSEEERYALGLVEPDKMKSLELGKDIDIMEEYVEEAEEVMEEEYFGESYDHELAGKEEAYKDGKNDGIKEGIKQGIKQGKEEGLKENQISTAKEMLKEGLDIDLIVKITKLTEEEIESLKS